MNFRIDTFYRPLLIIALAATLAACGESTDSTPDDTSETTQGGGKDDSATAEQSLSADTQDCRDAGDEAVSQSEGTWETAGGFQGTRQCMVDVRMAHLEGIFGADAQLVTDAVESFRFEAHALCDYKARALEPDGSLASVLTLGCEVEVEEAINYLLDGTHYTSVDFAEECEQDKTLLGSDDQAAHTAVFQEYECVQGLSNANISYLAELMFGELPEEEEEIGEEVATVELDEVEAAALQAADELAYVLSRNEDLDSLIGERILTVNQTRTVDVLVIATSDPFSYDDY